MSLSTTVLLLLHLIASLPIEFNQRIIPNLQGIRNSIIRFENTRI